MVRAMLLEEPDDRSLNQACECGQRTYSFGQRHVIRRDAAVFLFQRDFALERRKRIVANDTADRLGRMLVVIVLVMMMMIVRRWRLELDAFDQRLLMLHERHGRRGRCRGCRKKILNCVDATALLASWEKSLQLVFAALLTTTLATCLSLRFPLTRGVRAPLVAHGTCPWD